MRKGGGVNLIVCPECGSGVYRHGSTDSHRRGGMTGGYRYRCKNPDCRKCFTVRGGKIANPRGGRPPIQDCRYA